MRLRVLVAVFLVALPAGGVLAADSAVVLHLLGRTEGIPVGKLPPPDVPTKTYTVRGDKKSHKVTHAGISMTALFASQGAQVSQYKFVQIRRPDLSYMYLPPDTDAILWVGSDNSVHFLRPLDPKKKGDTNATDVFKLDPGKPLVMTARTGNVLLVTLSTSTTQAEKGQEITFSAAVTGQKKNDKLTYTWRFGDGQTGGGQSVKHTYDSTGRYNVFVSVTGSDDSAGSSDEVRITVGNPPATGTTGGGGATGGGNTQTSPPPVVNNTPQTPPAPITSIPKTEGTPGATKVTGILLASSNPVSADSLLSPGSRPLASTSSTPDLEVPLVGAAVVLLLGLGALFEGGGRIRIPKLWPR
jgi:PKD domain-containing protein